MLSPEQFVRKHTSRVPGGEAAWAQYDKMPKLLQCFALGFVSISCVALAIGALMLVVGWMMYTAIGSWIFLVLIMVGAITCFGWMFKDD